MGRRNLRSLLKILDVSQKASGQEINLAKSKCVVGGTSNARKNLLAEDCEMILSDFPDKYLGVILVPGIIRAKHVCMGVRRNVARKFSSIPIFNMSVYKWPKKVLKDSEKIIRNFLWSGDPSIRKIVTLKWEKTCAPLAEGRLGIKQLNKSMLMKMCWKIQNGNDEWSKFFQGKFQDKNCNWIDYYKKSSIWPGIKWVVAEVFEHSRWLVGDGTNISVWNDNWIKDKPLKNIFPENSTMLQNPSMKVADLIRDGEWQIPANFLEFFATSELPVIDNKGDRRIWSATTSGKFYVASASNCIRKKFHPVNWAKTVWHKNIHPNVSSNFINPKYLEDILKLANHKSPAIKELWRVVALVTLKDIWFLRNRTVYEEEQPNLNALKQRIIHFTRECDVRMTGNMWNSSYDLQVLKFFDLKCKRVKTTRITEIYFHLPNPPFILICCDGASRGNPGEACYGFICRLGNREYMYAMSGGLGLATNFMTEIFAILYAGEWAINNNFFKVCFQTDSQAAIAAFQNEEVPWWACTRWNRIKSTLQDQYFIHGYREINFSTDLMTKKRSRSNQGRKEKI
ncbi:uncharacterized protein LOC113312518 [Papaver somniferum]|uniref:uncharacterized protein LOC113312518 n=1 Tax=Papaver somniferum TaxID=3469 RepID=UPI000E703554|nr:uncharacterized protein LOC113312518 [Papaver somniferum]